jgi:aldo/keto reductase family protein
LTQPHRRSKPTPIQVALAWLLQRSSNILLIPETSCLAHLRENLQSSLLHIPLEVIADLNAIGTRPTRSTSRRSAAVHRGTVASGQKRCPFPDEKNQMVLSRRESPMELTKPKLPREAIELYNDFIHGEISRRAFMEGVQRLAGGLAAATVINALMPNYALGQQVSRTDERMHLDPGSMRQAIKCDRATVRREAEHAGR